MKFSKNRIDHIAENVYNHLSLQENVKLDEKEKILFAVRSEIESDLQQEEEIEEEARRILENNKRSIDMRNVSYSELFKRSKEIIAKERKFIL